MTTTAAIPIGTHTSNLAAAQPDEAAIISVDKHGRESVVTWAELDRCANQVARWLVDAGATADGFVVVALPNTADHAIAVLAAWKIGACPLPLPASLPSGERDELLALVNPAVIIAAWPGVAAAHQSLTVADGYDDGPLPPVIARPGRAIASGGSTGRPKVIVDPKPLAAPPGAFAGHLAAFGLRGGQTQLLACPLYHNFGNGWLMIGLFEAHRIILMERFDAALVPDLVRRHQVSLIPTVPTMMQRVLRLPDLDRRHFASVEAVLHTAAVCPDWVKRGWIDLVGAEHVYEIFGATEGVGACLIRGDEWLEHPGTVGRGFATEVRILDENGRDQAVGEVGEIYMRQAGILPNDDRTEAPYRYVGAAPATTTPDGFTSVGDLGWLDADGYLHIADRRVDLIVTGGVNVYPAEVEAVLSQHPGVSDVVVIGLPDEEFGKRVHAIVVPARPEDPVTVEDLDAHCRQLLRPAKLPRGYEFTAALPRNEAGKIRRSALIAERAP